MGRAEGLRVGHRHQPILGVELLLVRDALAPRDHVAVSVVPVLLHAVQVGDRVLVRRVVVAIAHAAFAQQVAHRVVGVALCRRPGPAGVYPRAQGCVPVYPLLPGDDVVVVIGRFAPALVQPHRAALGLDRLPVGDHIVHPQIAVAAAAAGRHAVVIGKGHTHLAVAAQRGLDGVVGIRAAVDLPLLRNDAIGPQLHHRPAVGVGALGPHRHRAQWAAHRLERHQPVEGVVAEALGFVLRGVVDRPHVAGRVVAIGQVQQELAPNAWGWSRRPVPVDLQLRPPCG